MKNKQNILLVVASISYGTFLMGSFSSPETNTVAGGTRQAVNFKGSLVTYQGNTYRQIDNISVNKKYRDILVIDKPENATLPQPAKNSKTGIMEIVLDKDPYKEYVDTKLDLSETKKIVAVPDILYVYKPDSKHRTIEFIEIKVISNDTRNTLSSYLIDHNSKVHFDEINEAGPIQKDAPISAVKELTITEYSAQNGITAGATAPKIESKKNKETVV